MIARAVVLLAWLKRHRELALLVAAIALGVLAAYAARSYIAGQLAVERDRLMPAQKMVSLVVAKRDLARGELASADTLAVREVPDTYAPQGAVTPAQFDTIAGAAINAPMRAGDPLLHAALAPPDAGGLSARIREGIRAMTIAVDEVNAISGMLQPGDRIDLLLSARLPASGPTQPQEVSRALMQDLLVLATGRQVRPGPEERGPRTYTTITVEVAPAQAQKLAIAQRVGKLTALLRNPSDRERVSSRPLDIYGLLDVPPAGPAVERRSTELIVGGVSTLRGRPGAGSAAPTPASPAESAADAPRPVSRIPERSPE
jgi:pilus assembly protein CpaB